MKAQEIMGKKVILTILLGVILIVFTSQGFAQGIWETKAPMPTARWGAATGVIDGKLYVVGGYSGQYYLATLEAYDPATDTWTTMAPMPTVRGGVGAGVIDGKLYVVGGGNSNQRFATLEVYDPATNTWATKASMPTARSSPQVVAIDSKLYVAGGCRGWCAPTTNVLQVYDPTTNSWATKTPIPTGVAVADFAVENDLFYVMGGWAGWYDSKKVHVYNPVSNTWTTKTDHNGMGYSTAGSINGKIYVARIAASEVYDPATDTWGSFPTMPTLRTGTTGGVINGKFYVVGGYGPDYIAKATLEVYDLNQPPEAKCKDVTVKAGSGCTAPGSIDDGSSDPDADPITLDYFPAGPYPKGDTQVTLTVTDDKGASDSCTANVTVIDNERPTITAPVPVSVSTDTDKCSASNVALGTPITGDNCGVTNVVNNAPSEFLKGITVFTWTVIDTSDNMNTGTQTVNVNDNTPPVPNAAELPTLQGQCSATISTYPTATDNCSGNLTGTTTDPLTYTSPGTYTVTWKYTDSSQNISTQMQGVIVKDTESPSILDIYATPSELWPPNKKMVDVTINYTPNDNCGQTTCSISNVSCNEKITSLDYSIVDAHHVKLRADRDGKGTGRVYTITINCKDAANNSTNQGVTVTVPHDQGSPK